MRFVIQPVGREIPTPAMPLGPRGRELACFIPPELEWRQVNYGQGEGQVEIAGCEWGFYCGAGEAIIVVLERGQLPALDAMALATRIAEYVMGSVPFEIILEGVDDPTTGQLSGN